MGGNRGKYTKINKNNPLAVGRCDYSGFLCRRIDLKRQMEYRGKALAWTGYWVYKKFLDDPNPQNMPPVQFPDPIPVPNPRPDSDSLQDKEFIPYNPPTTF